VPIRVHWRKLASFTFSNDSNSTLHVTLNRTRNQSARIGAKPVRIKRGAAALNGGFADHDAAPEHGGAEGSRHAGFDAGSDAPRRTRMAEV